MDIKTLLSSATIILYLCLGAGPVFAQAPGGVDPDNLSAAGDVFSLIDWARVIVATYLAGDSSDREYEPRENIDIEGSVKSTLSPLLDTAGDFSALAGGGYATTGESLFGANWNLAEKTDQAYTPLTATVDYYADSPDALRNVGYSLESGLADVDATTMSPLDYASFFGGVVAIPFLYIRGFRDFAGLIGPLGLMVSWLLLAAAWVTLVNFLSFLFSISSTIFSVGSRILELVGLVKP